MNIWQFEQYKRAEEYSRRRMIEEIRTERLIRASRAYRPGAFARTMYRFANWMIAAGKRLRRRYAIPSVCCERQISDQLI